MMNKHISIGLLALAFGFTVCAFNPSVSTAVTYYWDGNDSAAGFGTAGGTWAAPTAGTLTSGWSTSTTGVAVVNGNSITTATTDTVNFGNGATGLAAGTITVSGTVATGNMTFASGSGAITLSGGTISLGGGRTITANNASNVINSELALTGNSTASLNFPGGGSPASSSLTFGVISGTGNMIFQNTAGSNPNPARFIVNGASTYSGTTLLDSTTTNANIALRLGVDNALPTGTVLTIDGGNGAGSGRTANFELNGFNQTLGGLTNTAVSLRVQNVVNSSATPVTLTINDSGNRTFSGRLGNGGTNFSIVKTGAGNWTLSGADTNTYAGTTSINVGTITIAKDTALGATSGNTVVASGARLFTQTTNLSTAEPFNIAGNGTSATTGAINVGGSATGVVFSGAITLSGNATLKGDGSTGSTFSGGIDTAGNVLTISTDGGATVTVGTSGISGSGSVVKSGGGALVLNAASTYSGLTTVNGGATRITDASALGSTAAGTMVNGGGTGSATNARLELSGGITVTGESATIAGVGNFLGALSSFSGSNEWAGNVTINAAGTRLGASAGATLKVSGVIDSGANPYGLAIRTSDVNSPVILSGANTYLGSTSVPVGKLQLDGGDDRLPVATNFILGAGANFTEFDLNGRSQEIAGLAVESGATAANNSVNNSSGTLSTLTVNTAAASPSTFAGILKGNLALTKTGSDTLTLSGTNTYTGATTVNVGTLLINGDNSAASGAVTVAANAILGGSGTLGGATTVNGTIAPGTSPGTLTINNSLSFASTALLEYELNAADQTVGSGINDLITGVTDLTLDGTLNVTSSPLSAGTWRLFNYTGSLTNNTLALGTINLAPLHFATIQTSVANQVNLVVTVVPEPGSLALLALGVIGMWRLRRKQS